MEICKLGDLGAIVTGTTPPKQNPEYFSFNGVPFLTPSDMAFGRRRNFTERFLSPSGAEWAKKRILPPGASSVVCIGSIGKVSQIDRPTVTNQQLNSVIPDTSKCDSNFLYYSLLDIGSDLKRIAGGSTVPILNKSEFAQLEIMLPKLTEQRRIAGALGTLDDKIESNRQVILLAKQLILALYRETLGAGELTSYPLDELFEVQIGRTPPRKESEWFTTIERDSKAWASIKDMSSAEPFIFHTSERLTEAAVSKHRIPIVQAGNILLSFKLTVGRVCIAPYPMCTNEAIASLTPRLPNVRNWAYAYLLGFNYEQLGNTSSIGKAVNSKIIAAMPVLCPDDETLSKFSNSTDPLLLLAENCQRETQALCNLRDALLPELMSGRMRVDEAGRLLSEALDEEVADVGEHAR